MQLIGLGLLAAVVAYGFTERDMGQISAFDPHALIIVLCGSAAAIMISSTARASLQTLLCLRELLPFGGALASGTARLEAERVEFVRLWREGQRARALELADRSGFEPIRALSRLVISRGGEEAAEAAFLELRHDTLRRWQPATSNWELLARLGPSMGMVGTITGMIQLFRGMGSDDLNIGAAMSLALVATLYGIAFGAGVAGPIGHFLRGLLDERLGALSRCRQSAVELAASRRG
ncbi:MotA/TolQ/ExbB proton channel family protein [Myxococcota bacterium]|nr:MotA/TolQ/ExbB proton channel family protein [Myxococcota bacterium]MBU1432671.1 MotA/TolQ/ExbB proton channel family protein [Myxococcota bacterium]MBU1897023.1 MotA/TolQ/ExbB proton channel family protein [Myxococcota bacterium]